MRGSQLRNLALAATLAAIGGLVVSVPGHSQNYGGGGGNAAGSAASSGNTRAAVTDVVNQHVHALAITMNELNDIINNLTNDSDTIQFQTSSAYNGGAPNGSVHTHNVTLSKSDLVELRDTGTLTVQTEVADGHTHTLVFMTTTSCPGMQVSPSPSPSQTVSPSPSPSRSPSGSPSPSPSASTSPSSSPSPSPSSSASPHGSPSPSPSASHSPMPSPSPSRSYPFVTTTVTPLAGTL